jgi:hypothetical protein
MRLTRTILAAALLLLLAMITAAQNRPLAFEVATVKPARADSENKDATRPGES